VLDGQDLAHHLPEDRAAIGLVRSFQDCRLYSELSVEETLLVAEDARRPVGVVASVLRLPRFSRAEQAKRESVDAALAALGLDPFRHNLIGELSTGTRRIVDLATTLAAHPRLLLLDEPTAGIAQREAEAFGPLLRRMHEVTGATICLVEHDVPLACSLCDRLVVMEAGKVAASGTPKEVLADPVAIAAYLGASREALARSGLLRPPRRRRQLVAQRASDTTSVRTKKSRSR
jgi:ABC-type branched-subunit amino acid transport system ATPase component